MRYKSLAPYLAWRTVDRPFDWSGEVHVEIGFGNGDYLARYALDHPDATLVGLEAEWLPVQRTLRKLAIAGVTNARVALVDATVALERLFAPKTIAHAYCLFPCPWPKQRHWKFRLFSTSFLKLLNSRLRDDASAVIVTDDKDYFEWIQQELEAGGTGFDCTTRTVPAGFDTKYERKWQDEKDQHEFYEIVLDKAEHVPVPIKEDIELRTHVIQEFDGDVFEPKDAKTPMPIAFKESMFDPKRDKAAYRAIVTEAGLTQDFWVEISRGKDGWRIRPMRGCGMVPTQGVQAVLDTLAGQLG